MKYPDILVDAATNRVGVFGEVYQCGYGTARRNDIIRLYTTNMRGAFIVPRWRLYPAMPGVVRVANRDMMLAVLRVAELNR